MSRARIAFAAAVLIAGLSSAAWADSTGDAFDVLLEVAATCSVTATDHDFGDYDDTVGNVGASTLTVNCTLTTPYSVGIDGCTHGSGVADRQMQLTTGSTLVPYTLHCSDVSQGCFTNWGVTDGVDTYDSIGTGLDVPLPVVGQVAAGQNLPAGSFSDSCQATVSF